MYVCVYDMRVHVSEISILINLPYSSYAICIIPLIHMGGNGIIS